MTLCKNIQLLQKAIDFGWFSVIHMFHSALDLIPYNFLNHKYSFEILPSHLCMYGQT